VEIRADRESLSLIKAALVKPLSYDANGFIWFRKRTRGGMLYLLS
jgi:hypothetical protein